MPRRFWASLSIWCAILLSIMDVSIANVALPFISTGLQVSAAHSVWVVNAYQIAILMALLPFAMASEILGYKPVYLAGIVLFMIAAFGSIFASSLTMLAIARYAQGIGAAALMVVSGALVRIIYPPALVPRGIGYNTMAVSIASAAGPAVGALVLSLTNWRAIFAVSLPFGILALGLGIWALPTMKGARRQFDFISALLCCMSFGSIFLVITDLVRDSFSWWTMVEISVAIPATVLLGKRASVNLEPMVPFDLLMVRSLRTAYAMSASAYGVMMLITLSFPFILQQQFHLSPAGIGLLMVPMPLGIVAAAFASGRLVSRYSSTRLCGSGLIVLAGGAAWLATLQPGVPAFMIICATALCGIGFGLFQVPNNHIMLADAPRPRIGAASAMLSMSRLAGQMLGALLVVLLFRRVGAASDAPLIAGAVVALLVAGISQFGLRRSGTVSNRELGHLP